jgi:HlyD family secretion protein
MAAVRVTDPTQPDFVVTVVPTRMTGEVVVGQEVRLELASAPSSTFGYLLGTVNEVSPDPYTIEQIAQILKVAPQLVASELGPEPGLLARITLQPDADAPSGYRWTVGDGPPFVISQGAQVTAHVILDEQRPIDVVFPDLGGGS